VHGVSKERRLNSQSHVIKQQGILPNAIRGMMIVINYEADFRRFGVIRIL
jgi:hypothetical protein